MRIWFRVGMEADVSKEDMDVLLIYGGQKHGQVSDNDAYEVMKKIIQSGQLSGETYILGKNNVDNLVGYDNPNEEINFLY